MTPFTFFIVSFAIYRVVRLWRFDSISETLREALVGDPDDETGLGPLGWLLERTGTVWWLYGASCAFALGGMYALLVHANSWADVVGSLALIGAGAYLSMASNEKGRLWLADLLTCPWCLSVQLSFWALLAASAAGWIVEVTTVATGFELLALWFATAAAASWFHLGEGALGALSTLLQARSDLAEWTRDGEADSRRRR